MTNYNLTKARARDAPLETQPTVLPPSHSAWISLNGEPAGVDPDYSAEIHDWAEFDEAMDRAKALGATFCRWTRVDPTSGVLDAWATRPQFQGRVGYGQRIEVTGNSR